MGSSAGRPRPRRRLTAAALGLLAVSLVGAVAACGNSSAAGTASDPVTLRLGYFPNLTHATAIVGIQNGIFTSKLGNGVKLEVKTFNAGPEAVEALLSGAIDATYIGPNPTVNAWSKSKGKAVKVVAGAASGGVAFVVKPSITRPEDLKGKKIATPQLGNTQDVALRYWLKQHGLTTTKEGGGDVKVQPQANADAVTAFASGAVDGAWEPEPYASQLVAKGGKVLVDERDLWPGGKFVITNLLVRSDFLKQHRDVVKNLVAGEVAATDEIQSRPDEAQKAVVDHLSKLTGKPLDAKLTATAWKSIEFTPDPVSSSLVDGAKHAEEIGLLDHVDLAGLYDLSLLNEALKAAGKPEVKQP